MHALFVRFRASFDSLELLLLQKPTGLCPVVALGVQKHSGHVFEGKSSHGKEFYKSPVPKFRHTQATCAVKQDKHTSVDVSTQRGRLLYMAEHAPEAEERSSERNMIIWAVVRRSGHHLFQPYRLSPNMTSTGEISDESVCMVLL